MVRPAIVFRVDCNNQTGFGHFSRSLNLCRNMIMSKSFGWNNFIFVGDLNDFAKALLTSFNIQFLRVSSIKEEKGFNLEALNLKCTAVILDSYDLTQESLNNYSNIFQQTIIIDDTCELDYSNIDLVINFRHCAEDIFSYNAKETALELSKNFDTLPKNSISRIKKLSRQAYDNTFEDQLKLETDFMVKSQGDKESMEGIDAFLEKRNPDYKKLR